MMAALQSQPLSALLPVDCEPALADCEVRGLALDSRLVRPGDLFCALRGASDDGRDFITDAAQRGASAVLIDTDPSYTPPELSVPVVYLSNLRHQLSAIADRFYDAPSAHLAVTAVTGTDGKTSVCHLYATARAHLTDDRCGMIGSLGCRVVGRGTSALDEATGMTTPNPFNLQRLLALLRREGIAAVALEISSHALEQRRAEAVRIHIAVLTNLARDHLDYHGSFEAYRAAKARLFTCDGLVAVVLNADDSFSNILSPELAVGLRVLRYSLESSAVELHVESLCLDVDGIHCQLCIDDERVPFESTLCGRFNLQNLLAAAAALVAEDRWSAQEIAGALAVAKPPPGRLERVENQLGITVWVDYAHTPQGLTAVLEALRSCGSVGQLWCVFGCGGERDAAKRPLMGEVAERLADRVVLSDDNPRGESSEAILEEIQRGMAAPQKALVEPDRQRAIEVAIAACGRGDQVLIAGKGCEDRQWLASGCVAHSDVAAAQSVLRRLEGVSG